MYFYAQPLESHLGCRLQGCRVRHALHITMSRLIGGRARYCKFGVLHLLKAGESMWMGTPAANMSLASISWYKVSKKACLNKSLQKPSSRKQQLPDCISTESSSAEARLKNFTGDSRYDFCCCAVSSTHCYLQCLLRALSWVVAHPETSAAHRYLPCAGSGEACDGAAVIL